MLCVNHYRLWVESMPAIESKPTKTTTPRSTKGAFRATPASTSISMACACDEPAPFVVYLFSDERGSMADYRPGSAVACAGCERPIAEFMEVAR
jgi:hypothetical protein